METPEQIAGYRIEARVDRSGKAQVFKALGPDGRTAALKLYPPGESDAVRQRRLDALERARGLDHPSICKVIDAGEHEGRVYAASEFVQGASLDKVMRHRRVPLTTCLHVLRKASEGLEYLVRQGVDIDGVSPGDLLVHGDGAVVKILEPGMPLTVADDPSATATMSVLTSVRYLAPERMAGRADSAAAAAVYSLGVIGYEMLTGSAPVGRYRLPSTVDGDIPPEIDPVILKCLSKNPADRYLSPGALAHALGPLESRHGAGASLADGALRLAGGVGARWIAIGLGVAAVIALLWVLLG